MAISAPLTPADTGPERILSLLAANHVVLLWRRAEQAEDGRPFGSAEADVVAAMAMLACARRLAPGLARSVLARAGVRAAEAAAAADPHAACIPAACAVLAVDDVGADRPLVAGALRRATDDDASKGLLPSAWRLLLLARAAAAGLPVEVDRQSLVATAVQRAGAAVMDPGRRTAAQVSHFARYAYLTGVAGAMLDDERLTRAASAIVGRLVSTADADGVPITTEGVAPTRVLAQLALAADATGAAGVKDLAVADIARRRFDADRMLATVRRAGKVDVSPWIPLALIASGADTSEVADRVAPPLPDPPAFSLVPATGARDRLTFKVEDTKLAVDAPAVDLLLDRAVDSIRVNPPATLKAGALAERILALDLLDGRTADLSTREFADAQIAVALRQLVRTQAPDGTWSAEPEGRSSGAAQTSADAIARGATALAVGYERTGELIIRTALDRTQGALSDAPPGEGATLLERARRARLHAVVARIARGRTQLRMALRDTEAEVSAIARAVGPRMDADGSAALASGEAAELAYELAHVALAAGDRDALRLARSLLRELSGRLLPSGAVAPVRDYEERHAGEQRWLLHAEGIGPWPLRLETQLRLVAAAGLAGGARETAARTLGFALLQLVDESRGTLTRGYDPAGRSLPAEPILPSDLVPLAVAAVACTSAATGAVYRPRRAGTRRDEERSLRLLERLALGRVEPPAALARGGGAALLARITEDPKWRDIAIRDAQNAASGLDLSEYEDPSPGRILQPPPAAAAEVAALQSDVAALKAIAGMAPTPFLEQAVVACEALGASVSVSRTAGRVDLAATGGLRRWALGMGLAVRAAPRQRAHSAALGCAGMLLAQQRRDGRWPALVEGEDPDDVQLTVLEQLLVVHPIHPEADVVTRALVQGREAVGAIDTADLERAVRCLAIGFRVGVLTSDETDLAATKASLRQLVHDHRGDLGGLSVRASDPSAAMVARMQVLRELASVHAVDPRWLA